MSTLPNPLLTAAVPSLGTNIAMPGAVPSMGSPALPSVSLAPPPPPTQTQTDIAEYNRQKNTGSGVSQIQNPLLRGIARAGDIAASVFAPKLAQFIPGTTLHHQLTMGQAAQNVATDQAQEQAAAQTANEAATTAHTNAATDALQNPADKFTPLQTDSGLTAFDPSKGTATPILGADGTQLGTPGKAVPPHYVTTSDGNVVAITTGPDGTPKASTVYEGSPKQETEITKLEVGGKPHTVIVDKKTGATVKDLGETGEKPPSISVSTGTYSVAQVPDGKGGQKSVLLNSKTGEVKDAPEGLTKGGAGIGGTVADKNRSSLAKIALANIDKIQEIVQRRGNDLIGPGAGRISNIDQLIGSNDPDLVALVNEAHNFSMANAGVHGSRSVMNVRDAVHDLLGDLHNGPQGIQGGLDANRANLNAIINPNGEGGGGSSEEYVRDASGKLVKKGGK